MKVVVMMLAVLGLTMSACGSSTEDESEELKRRVAELEAAAATTTTSSSEEDARASTTTTAVATTAAPVTTTAPPTTEAPPALMPEVVCMNLQDAQDLIQSETGVFLSLSEDATGQGRSQLIDSNWIVVAQSPPAGTPIGEGDAVLSAVKLDEPNPC